MVQLQNYFLLITFVVVLCGTAAPVLLKWFVSRDVSTGARFFNGILIPILISLCFLLVFLHSRKFLRSMAGGKSEALYKEIDPILFTEAGLKGEGASSSGIVALRALCGVICILNYLLFVSDTLGDLPYLESFCGVLCLLFFCTFFYLSPNSNAPRLVNLGSARQSSSDVAISFESSASFFSLGDLSSLPWSRQPLILDHNGYYFQKANTRSVISHMGVFLFLFGVLQSNSKKIQFTLQMPLGGTLHMGKEHCCLRGLDHLHGPTFNSICGNLIIYKSPVTNGREV